MPVSKSGSRKIDKYFVDNIILNSLFIAILPLLSKVAMRIELFCSNMKALGKYEGKPSKDKNKSNYS